MADDGGGLRYNSGKIRVDLMPPEWPILLGDVLTQGAKKYAENNWLKGMKWSNMVGSMFRHLLLWISGENHDKETGCHHLAMLAWNALALTTYQSRGLGQNDLPFVRDSCEVLNEKDDAANLIRLKDE